jgi:hypothetical protein
VAAKALGPGALVGAASIVSDQPALEQSENAVAVVRGLWHFTVKGAREGVDGSYDALLRVIVARR